LYRLVQLDNADEASIVNAARQLEGEPIDLLINNAGIFVRADFAKTTKEDLMKTFEVNTVGPFLVTRALVPNLKAAAKKSGAAAVAQISSQLGSMERTNGGYYSYRASKAALNMINASLAVDLKSDGIAAFTFHPGYVATDINNHQGTISTETSASGLIAVIEKLTV
ncbi:Short chain dehydrogenase, partial [Globisporangium polare]